MGTCPINTIQYLVLDRCDPTCNMARYYVLSIEPSLFGDTSLIRQWGRIGKPGQTRIELYETQSKGRGSPRYLAPAKAPTWLRAQRCVGGLP